HVVEILDGVGDPVKRPEVMAAAQQELGRMRLGQGALAGDGDEGVQPLVEASDAVERRLDHLDRTQGARAKLRRQCGDGRELHGSGAHGRNPSTTTSSTYGARALNALRSASRISPGLLTRRPATPIPCAISTNPRSGVARSMWGYGRSAATPKRRRKASMLCL